MISKLKKILRENKWTGKIYLSTARFVRKIFFRSFLRKRNRSIKIDGEKIISQVEQALSQQDLTFFIAYGSLLGLIRDQKMLEWDYDIDYAILVDSHFSWDKLKQAMEQINFTLAHQFKCDSLLTEQTYHCGQIYIDFFGCFPSEDTCRTYSYYFKKDQEYPENTFSVRTLDTVKITGTKIYELNGRSYHIPNETEQYLSDLYKPTWRIPDPNWIAGSGPACHIHDELTGKCEHFDDPWFIR